MTARRVLVTGASGHVGPHLVRQLWERGDEVWALVRPTARSRVLSRDEWSRLKLVYGDLTDEGSVLSAVQNAMPEAVFHLAAQSSVRMSWEIPAETMDANAMGALYLMTALRRAAPRARVLVCGTSEQYGYVKSNELPIRETNRLEPMSFYGASKCAQEHIAKAAWRGYQIGAICVRSFDHSGPGRDPRFAIGDWARQIAEIEADQRPAVIKHGNLDARRDICDARDVARAYIVAVDKGTPGEAYNICRGTSWTMGEVLRMLVMLSKRTVKLEADVNRMRPADVPILIGDGTKFSEATGWLPEITIGTMLEDLLNWHRGEVAAGRAA